jgi:predicted nucleic acid-binding protein
VSYLIDTNVISEVVRPRPNSNVLRWFAAAPDESLHLSVLTLGELRSGVERLRDRGKKERLRLWLENDVPERFEDRLLSVSAGVADRWGRLIAERARPAPVIDSLLAATALQHGLRIVTRNTADFDYPGLDCIDPWS